MAHYSLEFIKADPSGNTTLFVLTPVAREAYASVSARLMRDRVLCAEQVGFIERPAHGGLRMCMMGGEFCGNASRSYAAYLAMAEGPSPSPGLRPLPPGIKKELQVEVSGSEAPLSAWVEDIGSPFGCFAEIGMPAPQSVAHGEDAMLGPYSLVAFEGITHGVLWRRAADEKLLEPFRTLLRARGLDDENCGIMFVENDEPLTIRPLVYIGEVGSLVWEQSCGSGSLATLCALADKERGSYSRFAIHQPGGTLELSGSYTPQGICGTKLAGTVYFPVAGVAQVEV